MSPYEPDRYRSELDDEEVHADQTATQPNRNSIKGVDEEELPDLRFQMRLRARHDQGGGKNSILRRLTSTGTMSGTTERVYFSGPYQQTDIDLDAIQAVDHRRDRGHMALYAFAAILGLFGMMNLLSDPFGGLIILGFAFVVGYIAYNIRGETLMIVTGGKTFKYRALTAQDSRKIGEDIRQLKRERKTMEEPSRKPVSDD